MITVTANEDGSHTIGWDENDPVESLLNDWSPEDFVRVITDAVERYSLIEEFAGNYEGPLYAKHPDLP
jgi:hypothetical protein